MLNDGIVVPKKSVNGERKWRIVVDFRRLNDITISDVFPLPNITDILEQLGKARYFTTLDLAEEYHQVPMAEHDKYKTAFSTQTNHYHFNRMPFGLKNAPSTFQRAMNNILIGLNGLKCFVYLDDIVIHGYDLNEHNQKLEEIFRRLRHFNLKLNPYKCRFLCKEILFLGHHVTGNGIQPDRSKTQVIQDYPKPTTSKEIKSFLGLCGYYRRFINNFAEIASPLTSLLKKDVVFKWDAFCENSFQLLKSALISSPILISADHTKRFIISCDASDVAIGAMLSQERESTDLPIEFASRTLNPAERKYPAIERELLAIVWAVKKFRPYIYGRRFIIRTDHKPLIWLHKSANPSARLTRWRIEMDDHEYDIKYKPGKINTNADALSRIETNVPDSTEINNIRVVVANKEIY